MTSPTTPTPDLVCEADGFEFPATQGTTLMQALRDNGFDIEASCDGNLACGTCHVHVDPEWVARLTPADEDERAMLDCLPNLTPSSRLACQIELTLELQGLRLTLPR